MKRLIHTLLTLTAMLTLVASCVKDPGSANIADPALGGTPVPVTFNLDLGFALSKADTPVSTALDDGTAVNKVFAAVFSSADGSLISTSKIGGTGYDETASMSGGKASVTITLAKGQDYKVVFFVQKDDTYQLEFDDGNRAVFSYRIPVKANDRSQDAFWAVVDVKSTVASYNVTLKRPFAQLNVLVPADGVPEGKTAFSSTLSVLAAPTSFDLFAGQPGTDIADLTFAEQAISAPAFGKYAAVDGVPAYQWVGMNFLLVPTSGKLSLSFKEKDMPEALVLSGIPVKVNGRTNLVGALYGGVEVDLSLNVQIDSGIGGGSEQKTDAEETEITIADGSTYTTDKPLVIDATGAPLMKVRLSVNGHSFSEVLAGSNGGTITARSADTAVATAAVDGEDVVITPVGNGETVVTVTTPAYTKTDYQGGSFKIPVKVSGVVVEKRTPVISVSEPADGKLALEEEGTSAIKATVLDGQEVVEGIAITFASSDAEVATVDKDGLVTAVKAGEATITLTTEENAGYNAAEPVTIAVTVTEPEPEPEPEPEEATLTVTPESLSLEVGATETLAVETNSSATPTFASDKESVATVDAEGKVTAVAEGSATITVAVAEVEGEFTAASKTVSVTVTKAEETPLEVKVVTVEEFLAAPDSDKQKYQLTGVVSGNLDSTYGNFDLVDATGTVYVYGLTATELGYGTKNDQSFGTLGIKAGDTVTLIGYRTTYKKEGQEDKPEVVYGYYVSHVSAPVVPADQPYKRVTSIVSGEKYILVGLKSSKYYAATPLASDKAYGRLNGFEITVTNDEITQDLADYEFTFTTSGDGYTIAMPDGRLLAVDTEHNGTFQIGDSYDHVFTATQADGLFTVVHAATKKTIYHGGGTYTNFSCASSVPTDGTMILLFSKAEGGSPVSEASVATGSASSVTKDGATLSGSYSGVSGEVREAGFAWGASSSPDAWNSEDVVTDDSVLGVRASGSFSADLDGLGNDRTYYFRAYIAVLEGTGLKYYYGEVRSFKTLVDEEKPSPVPRWYETPRMNVTVSGDYMIDSSDSDIYYAYHMTDVKGPGNKEARNYTVAFSAKHHCPLWVAAPRHSMYVGSQSRTNAYKVDPDIPASIQYKSKDTGGGCNKGHMLGSAERTASYSTNTQVFFYSNIAPQLSTGFNTGGGGWNILEDWVDKQVCSDTLYVVIGCYFDEFTDGYGKKVSPKTISFGGRNDVSMPTMFYYLLMRTKSGSSNKALKDCTADEIQCAAFVRSHSNDLKGQKVTSAEMMSVSDLEKITGFSYFPNVPNAPKDTFKASDWGL